MAKALPDEALPRGPAIQDGNTGKLGATSDATAGVIKMEEHNFLSRSSWRIWLSAISGLESEMFKG